MRNFERLRIDVLNKERESIQEKAFTKWCNSILRKVLKLLSFIKKNTVIGKKIEFLSKEWK